jgi:hypothetical protein
MQGKGRQTQDNKCKNQRRAHFGVVKERRGGVENNTRQSRGWQDKTRQNKARQGKKTRKKYETKQGVVRQEDKNSRQEEAEGGKTKQN